jgi:hypothetical protein
MLIKSTSVLCVSVVNRKDFNLNEYNNMAGYKIMFMVMMLQ